MSEQPTVADAPGPVPDAAWQELAGLDPATAEFPAQARFGNDRILVLRIGAGFAVSSAPVRISRSRCTTLFCRGATG